MSNFIKVFIIYILLYAVLATWLVHNGYISQTLMAITKEVFWFWFVIVLMIIYRKILSQYISMMYIYYLMFLFLICIWLVVTTFMQSGNAEIYQNIIIWLKYGILFMWIMMSASFVGFVYKYQNLNYEILIKDILQIVIFFLMIGLFWQWAKFIWPDFFIKYLWFWPIGDFDFGNPPLYYRTWPGGIARYNWVFSWPNNLWFLLVLLRSVVIFSKKLWIKLWQKILYVVICGIVMSRGLIVGVLCQTIIYIYIQKQYHRYIMGFGSVCILWIVWLSIYKRDSTIDHLSLFFASFDKFLANIWWYGLGSSGPAVHRHGTILPENFYLQIMIDFGAVWFVGFLGWRSVYIYKQYHAIQSDYIYMLLSIGLIWLFVEWLFLHVWEDSMVNYIFMIMYGMSWGYSLRK